MQKSLVLATVCPTRLHDSKFTVISGGHRAGAKFIWVGGESERRDENIQSIGRSDLPDQINDLDHSLIGIWLIFSPKELIMIWLIFLMI